ncbi:uncharacterized protein TrAtP1_004889 [Trichoderma atroviride]|uniref:uncharacterized protein n=1 Tax=Hypocrea atroviridis TaxID=63577 RepID=UPI003319769C|nr:hypothetical protein TrAtP1_004889 [Trichoderma atroviride]
MVRHAGMADSDTETQIHGPTVYKTTTNECTYLHVYIDAGLQRLSTALQPAASNNWSCKSPRNRLVFSAVLQPPNDAVSWPNSLAANLEALLARSGVFARPEAWGLMQPTSSTFSYPALASSTIPGQSGLFSAVLCTENAIDDRLGLSLTCLTALGEQSFACRVSPLADATAG